VILNYLVNPMQAIFSDARMQQGDKFNFRAFEDFV